MNSPTISKEAKAQAAEQAPPPWLQHLPTLLRYLGAAAVVFALYSFLMRGWSGTSDVMRYGVLLGHTGLLVITALLSARWLGESKGPRLLLVLGLISVAANFAVLGAFFYAAVAGGLNVEYPSYFLWSGLSLIESVALTAGSLLVILPAVNIGFRTLARGMAKPMASLFLLSNAVLLIPLRDTQVTALLVLGFGALVVWLAASISWQRIEVKTREGMTAILLLFLPLAILLGRLCWLYDPDALAWLAGGLLAFACFRQSALLLESQSGLRRILEVSSVWAALGAGVGCGWFLDDLGLPESYSILLASLGSAALLKELAVRSSGFNSGYRLLAGLIASLGFALALLNGDSGLVALLSLTAGIVLVVLSHQWQQKSLFATGVFAALAGLVSLMLELSQWFYFGGWVALAMIGVGAILSASILESRGQYLRQRWQQSFAGYRTWRV